MEVKLISDRDQWETFLAEVRPPTFLQSWNWGVVQEKNGTRVLRYGLEASGALIGVALVIIVEARRGRFLFCPHGPIFRPGIELAAALSTLLLELKSAAKKNRCAFIRISPSMLDSPAHRMLFTRLGFRAAPIHMMHPELAWRLRVQERDDELLRGMRKTTRYCIRKAVKEGIVVESSPIADFEKFWKIYAVTAARHSFVPFSPQDLRTELEVFSADHQAQLLIAKHNDQPIAAAIIIYYADSGFYHHGASLAATATLTATSYLLQWHAIIETRRRGLQFYNFWGIAAPENKRHPWAGITLFKTGFGGFSEQYLHAQDFVISPKYWITYIIERFRTIWRGHA